MGKTEKIMQRILSATADANIPFKALCNLLTRLEFEERVRGDHHIFTKINIEEIINLQPAGTKAKPYQVKQIRNLLIKYKLGGYNVE